MTDFGFKTAWCICGKCNTLQFRRFIKRVRVGSRHFIEDCTHCGGDSNALIVRFTDKPT